MTESDLTTEAALQVLRDQIILLLARKGWGLPKSVAQRMDHDSPSFISVAECSRAMEAMEEEFDQALFHLPAALGFLHHLPLRNADLENEIFWAGGAISRFLATWHRQLQETGLSVPILNAIRAILRDWNTADSLRPGKGATGDEVLLEGEISRQSICSTLPCALLLDQILEAKVPSEHGPLFERLFRDWTDDDTTAQSSANLLALLLFVRTSETGLALATHPQVLDVAFDESCCRRHWLRAAQAIGEQYPDEYVRKLKQTLLPVDREVS